MHDCTFDLNIEIKVQEIIPRFIGLIFKFEFEYIKVSIVIF